MNSVLKPFEPDGVTVRLARLGNSGLSAKTYPATQIRKEKWDLVTIFGLEKALSDRVALLCTSATELIQHWPFHFIEERFNGRSIFTPTLLP